MISAFVEQEILFSKPTGGGLILHIPVFTTTGRILVMYATGSLNSSGVGWKTGASGGGMNSSIYLSKSFMRIGSLRNSV